MGKDCNEEGKTISQLSIRYAYIYNIFFKNKKILKFLINMSACTVANVSHMYHLQMTQMYHTYCCMVATYNAQDHFLR